MVQILGQEKFWADFVEKREEMDGSNQWMLSFAYSIEDLK